MNLVNIELPRLIVATDYAEFYDLEDKLRKLNRSLRCKEVGFTGERYVGVVYAGRKPGKVVLRALAAAQRIKMEAEMPY